MPEERLKARLDRIEAHLGLRPPDAKPRAPFYGHTPASGMHRLKDAWNQMESIVTQCNWLNDEIGLAISATLAQAPDRPAVGRNFCLSTRTIANRPQNGVERQLEWDLYNRSRLGQNGNDAGNGLFQRLVGFQVPIYDNNLRDGWDKIDLVGIDGQGDPVIIELKKRGAGDKPLRVIMECVAYAIALKKVWAGFHTELANLISNPDNRIPINPLPERYHVCLLAPGQNWENWNNYIANNPEVGESLSVLIVKLGEHGFPLRCGSIDGLVCTPVQFP